MKMSHHAAAAERIEMYKHAQKVVSAVEMLPAGRFEVFACVNGTGWSDAIRVSAGMVLREDILKLAVDNLERARNHLLEINVTPE